MDNPVEGLKSIKPTGHCSKRMLQLPQSHSPRFSHVFPIWDAQSAQYPLIMNGHTHFFLITKEDQISSIHINSKNLDTSSREPILTTISSQPWCPSIHHGTMMVSIISHQLLDISAHPTARLLRCSPWRIQVQPSSIRSHSTKQDISSLATLPPANSPTAMRLWRWRCYSWWHGKNNMGVLLKMRYYIFMVLHQNRSK